MADRPTRELERAALLSGDPEAKAKLAKARTKQALAIRIADDIDAACVALVSAERWVLDPTGATARAWEDAADGIAYMNDFLWVPIPPRTKAPGLSTRLLEIGCAIDNPDAIDETAVRAAACAHVVTVALKVAQ